MNVKSKDFIYIFIFLITLAIFILIYLKVDKIELLSEREIYEEDEKLEEVTEYIDTIWVENIEILNQYKKINISNLSEKIRNLFLKDLYELKNEPKIDNEYYDNNKEKVDSQYCINNYASFNSLYNYLYDYQENVKKIRILKDTVKEIEEKLEFNIEITFNDEFVKRFTVVVINYNKDEDSQKMIVSPSR